MLEFIEYVLPLPIFLDVHAVCAVDDTVKPRFTNASDHEQFGLRTNFPNTKRSDDVLCLELRTRKPSTSWSDKLVVISVGSIRRRMI